MKIQKFLDTKHGKFIGRVYMLALLLLCNAFIAIGASMYYNYSKTPILLIIGVVGTIVLIGILSTPTDITELKK